jgi:hypothetical protein
MSVVHLAMSRYSVTPEFREAIERQANELVTTELGRCDDDWRSALLSLRETVAALERAYDVIVNRGHTTPSGALSLHVDGMLETAAEEVDRASEHVLAETRLQLGQTHARAERLDAELGVARDELTDTRARLDAERTVRARAESESADARARYEQTLAEREADRRRQAAELDAERMVRARAESESADARARYEQTLAEREADLRRQAAELDAQRHECATLTQQLAAVRAGNQTLLGMLQTFHGQIGRVMTSVLQAGPEGAGEGHGTSAGLGAARTEAVAAEQAPARPAVAPAEPAAADASARHAAPPPAGASAVHCDDPALATYATTLLDAAESSYREDLESGLVPLDVVERLTSNLRRAHDLFAQHAGHLQNGHASLFETTVMRLVDTRGGTAFGRHLGIAAYELFSPRAASSAH